MMKSFYGLQEGDVIVEVYAEGGVMMRADQENDAELFKAQVAEAYQLKQPIIVKRGGKEIKLEGSNKTSAFRLIQNQLDQIKGQR